MTDFNVYEAIRAILDDSDLSDPVEVAEKLLADMDLHTRALAFEQVATTVVSVFITRDRMRTPRPATEVQSANPGRTERPATPQPVGTPSPAPAASSRRATKADLVREWWRGELRKSYRGAEDWLRLADFSTADHLYAAQERHGRAAALTFNAEWHEACAEAMEAHEVDRFEDLPPSVLAALIAQRRPE